MIRLGVLGWPVAHSRSPAIQNAALAAVGLGPEWHYQLLPVPPELFDETVRALPASGFRGANVTIPHKHAALLLADTVSDRAREIGAVNTLLFEPDGHIAGDNTDAPALVHALEQLLPIAGRKVVVLGAGGSARAAVWALVRAGASVHVWNRSGARAQELCAALGGVVVERIEDASGIDVLVNCTSVGLHEGDSLAELPIAAAGLAGASAVVDFVYTAHGTPLLDAARAAGIPTIDGLELLVGQGALSFEQFTGCHAPVDVMRVAVGLSSAP